MKQLQLLGISGFALLLGAFLYAYFNEWIIVRNPWRSLDCTRSYQSPLKRTIVSLFFWHHESWQCEKITLGLSPDPQECVLTIINAWLHEACQLGFIAHTCTAQAALFDNHTRCLYASFTATPFDLQKSTYAQITLLESLLYTMRYNDVADIKTVQLLVNHALIKNSYLNCTQPFPINGLGIIK
jgi:hypothetical protein